MNNQGQLIITVDEKDYSCKELVNIVRSFHKAVEALKFYASGQHIDSVSMGSSYSIRIEEGTKAKKTLEEIKNV